LQVPPFRADLEGKTVPEQTWDLAQLKALRNTDYKFTTLNVTSRVQFLHMEIEEAIIVGLLAVGMSLLAVLTIMVFW
jgi:hypothetical protein